MPPFTAPELISAWSRVTGQIYRIVNSTMAMEAGQAAEAGFTEEDIALWYKFMLKEIDKPNSNFSASSLQWRVNAADGWERFQSRLGLAREAVRRGSLRAPKPLKAIEELTPNIIPLPEPPCHAPGSLLATVRQDIYRREA